jgi:hypothetical protein
MRHDVRSAVAVDLLALGGFECQGLDRPGPEVLADRAEVAQLAVYLYGYGLALLQGFQGALGVLDLGLFVRENELNLSAS